MVVIMKVMVKEETFVMGSENIKWITSQKDKNGIQWIVAK